ncbi:lipopolysaccharide biosynthesis protein [Croceibacterium ferulae]|uniref:lipopolysaccharide biosynthesis protein n=1 Tax=Croceibacterium ferulae TaxID=1854641 RepID=UPI000EAB568C|nr:oligosaccharide flippase family protein [Croceibacterium ferulae]
MAALAKGGRTNLIGFMMRLAARLPFLFIAGRLYGAEALGRFASAVIIVELVAMLCTVGEKRGLAQRLAEEPSAEDGGRAPEAVIADGLLLATISGVLAAGVLWLVPQPMFPSGLYTQADRLMVLAIPALALTEILLAAQAYRFDIAATVRARAIVEPWTISIAVGVLFYVTPDSGLGLAYLLSIYAALVTALFPYARTYGRPRGWRPSLSRSRRLLARGSPLAAADAIEWGTRRLDIFILGLFAAPAAVGIYYVAQQVASLPQKLKTSFEPILGPVLTRKLAERDYAAIARQVCQVGFWITAAQAGVSLALGIPGEAIMGIVGPGFVGGNGALAFLLLAEVVAATAVVAESALVYVARLRNLWLSIATIVLQGVLTVGAMLVADSYDLPGSWRAAMAAGCLMVALAAASLAKATLLGRILGHMVNNWRWALVWAALVATAVGQIAIRLPEWAELVFGIPMILAAYGLVIWRWGFGPEDRVLFTRKLAKEDEVDTVEQQEAPKPLRGPEPL